MIISDLEDRSKALDKKIPRRVITMWPALMFAASRKDRVRGRTSVLIVSTKIRKGFSQSGAPGGSRFAANFFGAFSREEIIRLSHRGMPKDMVKIRCLVDENV